MNWNIRTISSIIQVLVAGAAAAAASGLWHPDGTLLAVLVAIQSAVSGGTTAAGKDDPSRKGDA